MSSATKLPSTGQEATPAFRPRVRDRIFETACDLFYQQGIRAVGVDTIATEAGTNKMSFYRSFSSKDDLVAEYLREKAKRHWEWWDEVCARHPDNPRQQAVDIFSAVLTRAQDPEICGCAIGKASVEIRDESHPAYPVMVEFKTELRRRWHDMAHAMDAEKPEVLGDGLFLLIEGAQQTRLVFSCAESPAHNIVNLAEALIAELAPKA